ncbi:MAG: FtsX-like permease family protein [Candidatus Aminicenantaceae bacterium]|jgi:putative ABC transport system permease protein
MKLIDYVDLSFSNLWKRKLRTFLTIFGVIIGIGALVAMVSFGKGMQKNVSDQFENLELFNYITVFSESFNPLGFGGRSPRGQRQRGRSRDSQEEVKGSEPKPLDDEVIAALRSIKGVESVFPDIRFPAEVRVNEEQVFSLIQVLPAEFAQSTLMSLRAGKAYVSDEEDSLIISDSLLRRIGLKDLDTAIGQKVRISTLILDFSNFNPMNLASMIQGENLPIAKEDYEFTIVGITGRMGFGSPTPLRSDVFIPRGTSERMKKLPFTNMWDFFRRTEQSLGYSVVNIKVESPAFVNAVKTKVQEMGYRTFALIDQFEEIRTGFLFMDMILAAVGMIAIVVASLGIMNTMVMSILERYSEIGIMKAVGAGDGDIKKIFFFESSVIGFFGGVFGLALGWVVSGLINRIINYFLAKQGVPFIDYFNFPWWLCLGAVLFAVVVSLVSGIYPAVRAARVDPVVALRHD